MIMNHDPTTHIYLISIFSIFIILFSQFSTAIDTLFPNQTIKDDGNKLVSASKSFELRFFSPPNTKNRYIAIWFKKVPHKTPIWVANRNNPVLDSSGEFTITVSGNVIIKNNKTTIWTSNSSSLAATNPFLKLLDNGNLVVKNENENDFLWQSFDTPSDTLVPGMKLGWNLKTNQEWFLTSWKNSNDPYPGDYTYRLDPRGLGQIVFRFGPKVKFRSGPWVGDGFAGGPPWNQNSVFDPIFVYNSSFVFYTFENIDSNTISRFVVSPMGLIDHLTWNQMSGTWVNVLTFQLDSCDNYGTCGANGICNIKKSPICDCLKGFLPKVPLDWDRLDWSGGCVRRVALNCSATLGFIKFPRVKLPDSKKFVVDMSDKNEMDCREICLRNCSCVAYAETSVSGCVIWFGALVDMRIYSERGQDLFIKVDASEIGSHKNKRTVVIASLSAIAGTVLILGTIILYFIKGRKGQRRRRVKNLSKSFTNYQVYRIERIKGETIEDNSWFSRKKIGTFGFGNTYLFKFGID